MANVQTNNLTEYNPNWLQYAVPLDSNNVSEKCTRYQFVGGNENIDSNGVQGRRCDEGSFNQSHTFRCDEFIFLGDEVTVLNEVRHFLYMFFFLNCSKFALNVISLLTITYEI